MGREREERGDEKGRERGREGERRGEKGDCSNNLQCV